MRNEVSLGYLYLLGRGEILWSGEEKQRRKHFGPDVLVCQERKL